MRWRDDFGERAQTFRTKSEADTFRKVTDAELAKGTHVAAQPGAITMAAWAVEWLRGARNLGRGGRETYQRDLDRYILKALGDVPLRRVTPEKIDLYLESRLEAGAAASSVHREYRTIRRMLHIAVERRRLPSNPCDAVTPPKVATTEMRFLEAAEVDALAGAIADWYRAWVLVATYGGLRWSELRGLRRGDIEGARVTVASQLVQRAGGEWERDAPKTRAGRRVVTLPAVVADDLAAHIDTYSLPGVEGLVFPNRGGRPLQSGTFTANTFKPALVRAGIDRQTRIHDLRHTAVALAVKAGAHPKAIQVRMGHASIAITLDRYGHLFPEIDAAVAEGLDEIIRRTRERTLRTPDTAPASPAQPTRWVVVEDPGSGI